VDKGEMIAWQSRSKKRRSWEKYLSRLEERKSMKKSNSNKKSYALNIAFFV